MSTFGCARTCTKVANAGALFRRRSSSALALRQMSCTSCSQAPGHGSMVRRVDRKAVARYGRPLRAPYRSHLEAGWQTVQQKHPMISNVWKWVGTPHWKLMLPDVNRCSALSYSIYSWKCQDRRVQGRGSHSTGTVGAK